VRRHKKAGAHLWVRTFGSLYFLLFSGSGAQSAHPEKKFVTKKVLRLSPPHWFQSPEVPFLIGRWRAKQKATRVAWPCRVNEGGSRGTYRDASDQTAKKCSLCPHQFCSDIFLFL